MKKKSLVETHPELVKQWHPTKNENLIPQNVSYGSNKKVWWQCEHGHEWETSILNRSKGNGCPYCSGRQPIIGKTDLATVKPHLVKEWHPTKNRDLTPQDVTKGAHYKVWWQCNQGHEWRAQIYSRSNGSGCPYCSGKKVLEGYNDLVTTHPELAKEWHPTKNGDLTPQDVTKGSNYKAWWQCNQGHEWEATAPNRLNGNGCPYCSGKKVLEGYNDLVTTHPELAKEWHPIKNGALTPQQVSFGVQKKVWWRCDQGHEWEAVIGSRRKSSCPYCGGKKVLEGYNDLQTKKPELAKEWHPIKNGALTPQQVSSVSGKKVWWMCEHGHEWESKIANRSNGNGCPYCSGKKVLEGYNDLVTTHPELAKGWHPTKNGDLTPQQISFGNSKKVWWICEHGHEWGATTNARSAGSGCPYCGGQKVWIGYNDLETTHPHLTKEWHPTKNGDLTPQNVSYGSGKKVWWQCNRGHEWEAVITSRSYGCGCPRCNGLGTSFPEQCLFFYIQKIFTDSKNRHKLKINKKNIEVDIFIPELNLGIEYDGFHWHKNKKEKDFNKSKALKKKITLIRIREELPPIDGVYCIFTKAKEKEINFFVEKVFEFILNEFPLNQQKIDLIKKIKIDIDQDRDEIIKNFRLNIYKNSLLSTNPDLAKEWHPIKNNTLKPENFSPNAKHKAWWQCNQGHEWRAQIYSRSNGNGCPYCSGREVLEGYNDLQTKKPELAKEWHPTKNGDLAPQQVSCGSHRIIWWQCKHGHEWEAQLKSRYQNGYGCPYCSGRLPVEGKTDLSTVNPKLAKEWHPTKNGDLTPQQVSFGSNKEVWWQCNRNHEWKAKINNRNNGRKCPYCSNKKILVGDNDLATTHPDLAKEWHLTKNNDLTPLQVSYGSERKVWWQCQQGHEWQANINSRSIKGSGCPHCHKIKKTLKQN